MLTKKKVGRPINQENRVCREREILATAAKIFSERGYPHTTVDSIADALGIGKGTIYRYFSTKKKLFLATVDSGMRSLSEQIDSSVSNIDDSLEKIARVIHVYLAFFDTHPEFVELFIQERAQFKDRKKTTYFIYHDENLEKWHEILLNLIKQEIIRDIPVERIVDVVDNLLYGAIFTNYFAGRKKSFETQAQDILDILFHGIVKQK